MTWEELTNLMRQYNQEVAPGGHSQAWEAYIEDCYRLTDMMPWDDAILELEAPAALAAYWTKVAEGRNPEWNSATGQDAENASN